MSIGLAFKAFFRILSDSTFARNVEDLFHPKSVSPTPPAQPTPPTPAPKQEVIAKPLRSEAVTLLSTLQREARLIDFFMENISSYDDAQVGAAVREIHKKSGETLQKNFAIKPATTIAEGENITVPENFDQGQYTLVGKVSGAGPFKGKVEHGGWKVTTLNLPTWNGSEQSASIIAPIEVEIS